MKPIALLVGSLGVVGRGLVSHLLSLPDWDVVALSRRAMEAAGRLRSISVDLLDWAQCQAALGELWHLTELATWLRAHNRFRFFLIAPPLRLPGAVGSPIIPVATV